MPQSLFEFHTGFSLVSEGEQSTMDCPFCESEGKFYFNKEGMWDCKSGKCKASGNTFSFIRKIYDLFDTKVKASNLVREWRGIPVAPSMANGLKFNELTGNVIFPAFKHDKVYNLYKVIHGDKIRVLSSPGMDHGLLHFPETTNDTVWVLEGHWDRLVAESIIGPQRHITPVGVPGAGVWKSDWCEVLDGKHVVFLYDNDANGKAGYERVIIKEIAKSKYKPKSIKYLSWPEGIPEKYDVSDCYLEFGRKSFDFIESNLKEYKTAESVIVVKETIETVAPDPSCDSWDKLLDIFRKAYYVTPDMEMALCLLLCSVYSLKIDGEQLWYKIIGPPGSGKTTLAKIMSACEQVVLKSTFTGLFSGYMDGSGDDHSLVKTISNKMLMVKDADALIKQPNVQQIFSELRDFYDKDSSTGYRHGHNHDYRNVRSTMILCGTNVLRRADSSFLGERFLDFELRLTSSDETQIKKMVRRKATTMALSPESGSPDTPILAACKGFVESHLLERRVTKALDAKLEDDIDTLATLVAQMRTKVDRDAMGKGEVTFAPVIEVPSRLIGQLMKQAMIIPVVTGDNRYSRTSIIKIARDIIDPSCNRYRICQDLREGFFSIEEIVQSTGMSLSTVKREMDNLRALNLLEIQSVATGVSRRKRIFSLTEKVKEGINVLGSHYV